MRAWPLLDHSDTDDVPLLCSDWRCRGSPVVGAVSAKEELPDGTTGGGVWGGEASKELSSAR